jgi:4-amino-4-deoxy-L-arabinose transferase-like glycosyltransferase
MKMSLIKEVLLYRYRFALGYTLYGIFVILLLFIGLGRIPLGLTLNEMRSVVTSAQFTPDTLLTASYLDAPYHIVQNISVHFLGLTELAIKLPSVIFALITAVALVVMLSRWFQPRIAIITGLIAVTTTPFLAMGRLGLPLIMMAFWLAIILLSATRILHSPKRALFWKFVLAISIGFSIYTPLMIYPIIALSIAGLLHPHVRYVIRTMKPQRIILAGVLFLLTIAPLGWSIYQHPSSLLALTGLPSDFAHLTFAQITNNLSYVSKSIVRISTPIAGEIITPLYGIVTLILIALGALKSGAEWFSARSYMIGLWLLLLAPVIIVNPYYLPAIYVPSVLLLAIGIETLIRSWYRLFPRNPYARIAGLIPLTILIATVALTNAGRYF